MKRHIIAAAAALSIAPLAQGFDSGSTGADGAFNPTANITIEVPEDGIFNYTTLNIPENVTVRFIGNQANTPAFILVQGDAVIDGTINMDGVNGGEFGIAPAGGYLGGFPQAVNQRGGTGQGPGGGEGGIQSSSLACAGAGAGYFTTGTDEGCNLAISPGSAYGSGALQPLIGGSGGGAGFLINAANRVAGLAGGGGGGALLLAVSGTLTLNGSISVTGGNGASDEDITNNNEVGAGGGGSGGGIRIVASNLSGNGTIDVNGGSGGVLASNTSTGTAGGNGSPGRARIEAENFNFTGSIFAEGVFTSSAPRPLFLSEFPEIRIATIAGQTVPLNPIGENDVVLPANTPNPIEIEFTTSNVPVGSTVQLIITPINGRITNSTSDPLSGTLEESTASVSVTLPEGPSTLIASVAFAPNSQQSSMLERFTNGESIAQMELKTGINGVTGADLHTVNGNIYPVSRKQLPF